MSANAYVSAEEFRAASLDGEIQRIDAAKARAELEIERHARRLVALEAQRNRLAMMKASQHLEAA